VTSKTPIIFLSAAEASGDRHGAALVRALRRRVPEARILGTAGPLMTAAGCEVVADLTAQASMVGGPFLKLGYWFRTVKRLASAVRDVKPDVLVPIDSPALNWHLCKAGKSAGASVMYYIAPQVWAWAPWRIRKIRRLTDTVACLLPFEETYFRQRGVNARFVGHPLFDVERGEGVSPAPHDDGPPDLLHAWGEGQWRIAVVPGSRPGEVAAHIMPLLTVMRSLAKRWPKAQFTLAVHNDGVADILRDACRKAKVDLDETPPSMDQANGTHSADETSALRLVVGQTPRVLATSHFGLIKSGTVTLEAAAAGLPMVIFYKTGPIMAALYRALRRFRWAIPTPYLSLVNILAGQELVTELMPWRGGPSHLEAVAVEAMSDLGHLHELREDLLALVAPLQPRNNQNAADRAADMVLELLRTRQGG